MQIAIIAGGLGTRLGKITENKPKSLIDINGKPFIEYQLEYLKTHGISDVVLCLGHLGKQIENYCGSGKRFDINIKYSYEDRLLDTAGALKIAEPLLDDYFFTIYGDSYIFLDFREMFNTIKKTGKLAGMAIFKNDDLYDRSNAAIKDGLVIYYSKEKRNNLCYIDYGVNLFRKNVLDMIPDFVPYSMGALFNQLINKKELVAYEVKKRFYEIGSISGLIEFTNHVNSMELN